MSRITLVVGVRKRASKVGVCFRQADGRLERVKGIEPSS